MNLIIKSLSILFLVPLHIFAQIDVEGSKDHLLIQRFPGATIVYYDEIENGNYEFVLGPLVRSSSGEEFKLADTKNLQGRITTIQYKVNESDILKIVNYYEHSLKANGFEINAITKAEKTIGIAGRNWTLMVYENLPTKEKSNIAGTKTGNENRYYIACNFPKPDRNAYVAMIVNKFDENEIYIHVDIIVSELGVEKKQITSAKQIEQNIIKDGYAVINGIYFGNNNAEIQKESEPAIGEIAQFLKKNMGVSLYVVGHTGMMGSLDFQIVLSKNMADAVVEILTKSFLIASDRLIPQGVGPLSPVATTLNVEGREINRRIELVLISY